MHARPVFALAGIQQTIIEEFFAACFAKFLGEFMLVRIHAAPGVAPARIQDNIFEELYMYWFCGDFAEGLGLGNTHKSLTSTSSTPLPTPQIAPA